MFFILNKHSNETYQIRLPLKQKLFTWIIISDKKSKKFNKLNYRYKSEKYIYKKKTFKARINFHSYLCNAVLDYIISIVSSNSIY